MGLYLHSCGVPLKVMANKGTDRSLGDYRFPARAHWLKEMGAVALYEANDALGLRAAAREARLTKIFRQHGVAVTFVGKG